MKFKKYFLFFALFLLAGASFELGHYHPGIWTIIKDAWNMRKDSPEIQTCKTELRSQLSEVDNLKDIVPLVQKYHEDKICTSILASPEMQAYIDNAENYFIRRLQRIVDKELHLTGLNPHTFDFTQGLDVMAEDNETALHYLIAALLKRPLQELARPIHLMIANGANINARNIKGQTPLMFAVIVQSPGLVEYLVAMGADITVKDNEGRTALDYARDIAQKAQSSNEKIISKTVIELLMPEETKKA